MAVVDEVEDCLKFALPSMLLRPTGHMRYDRDMRREEVISRIQANAAAILAFGAERLYLYGSIARDAGGPDSDVDIFIDRDPLHRLGFIELTELEFLLRDVLGTDVDLSTRTALHPALSEKIEQDAIRVL